MRTFNLAVLALVACACAARAQVHLDFVQILQQFVTAETAAKLCGAPATSGDQFVTNRFAVTVRATQALIERNPTLPPDVIKAREAAMIAGFVEATSALVQHRGCSDPDVGLFLKRYDMQSRIDLSR